MTPLNYLKRTLTVMMAPRVEVNLFGPLAQRVLEQLHKASSPITAYKEQDMGSGHAALAGNIR